MGCITCQSARTVVFWPCHCPELLVSCWRMNRHHDGNGLVFLVRFSTGDCIGCVGTALEPVLAGCRASGFQRWAPSASLHGAFSFGRWHWRTHSPLKIRGAVRCFSLVFSLFFFPCFFRVNPWPPDAQQLQLIENNGNESVKELRS